MKLPWIVGLIAMALPVVAEAHDHFFVPFGLPVPPIVVHGPGFYGPRVYVQPPVVYAPPPPVYVAPAPVYVAPPPVVYDAAPVVVSPPPVVYGPSVRVYVGPHYYHSHYYYRH